MAEPHIKSKTEIKAKLTEGAVGPLLLKLALPMLLGIISMVAFNLIDTYFVGQLSAEHLAAISFTFPVILIVSSISMGLGVGASSVVSRAIGNGDQHMVRRLTTDSLFLAFTLVLFVCITGLFTIEPLFTLLGAKPNLMPHIKDYMTIWYAGIPFVVIPMVGNNAIRATGDTKTPSMVMLSAVLINIILDPLLIFGIGPFPRLELQGAAIATVAARMVTLIVSIYVLYFRDKMITLKIPPFDVMFDSWKQILRIGIPMAGTNLIAPVSIGILTRLVAEYGPKAVAGFGVGTRLDMFALTPVMALSSVLGPFIGQNVGAKNFNRLKEGTNISFLFAIVWGVCIFLLFILFKRPIAELFNKEPAVITVIVSYLLFVSIGYSFNGILTLATSIFNAANKPFHSTILGVVRMIVLLVPFAYLGSYLYKLDGIFIGITVSALLSSVLAIVMIRRFLKNA